jgi:hypothetical protein
MSLQIGARAPPAYFKVILNTAAKRLFNAARAHKRDRLGPHQNAQEFLALNRQQLQQTLSSMFLGHHVTYFPDAASCVNNENVGLGIAGLLDAHDNLATQSPVILSAGFEVEVVGSRQILILHARVQASQVVSCVPTSAGGSDSSVYTEARGNLRQKADTRNAFNTVTGLWPRTDEGLPLQWSEVPLWVKQMCVTAFKTELSRTNINLTESVDNSFSK